MTEESPDLDRVLTEIQDEVRRRRAAGDLPPSLERELDLLFDRFTPSGTLDGDFSEALKAADRASFVNVNVPTASEKPGVAPVKRALRKGMAWYLEYLAQQVTAFGSASVRALRALGERVGSVEEQLAQIRPAVDDPADRSPVPPDLGPWVQAVTGHLGGCRGRVLHVECGDGALLRALAGAGLDAYGVDPRGPLVDAAVASGLDAWPDDPLDHLSATADASLGGLVLSGCVDRLGLAGQRRLAALAAARVAPGGRLALVGIHPEHFRSLAGDLEADLAPGRPLSAVTWAHLLGRAGFSYVAILPPAAGADGTFAVVAELGS
ncbi:MAG TPA: methionine biosynthesis protein MetW [Acidimicrobiales bacterium]|nr:methionine biosynthesis protein MetW [Acidimicrobiales bacterium]